MLLLACVGDFSSVEARSTFSSAMVLDSCSTPGSDEGDASSASGDILTFPRFAFSTTTLTTLQAAHRPSELATHVAAVRGRRCWLKRATRQAGIEPRGAGRMPGAGAGAGTPSRSRVPGAHREALCDGLCSANKPHSREPALRAARQRCIPPR